MENNIHLYIMPAKVRRNKTRRRVKHRSRRSKARRRKTSKRNANQRKTSKRKANQRKSRNKNQFIIDNRYRVIKRLSKREYTGGNPEWWDRLKRTCGLGFQFPESIPYKFINKLGQGGQGEVYLVEDKQTREIRAMKVGPLQDIDHEYGIIRRMMSEVTKYSDIKIVSVYDIGVYNDPCSERLEGFKYLIMDYIQGEELLEIINYKKFKINIEMTIYQITKVVDMMHSMSPPLYHCDIKPENIMVTSGGDAYLIDFGYATIDKDKSEKIYTVMYSPVEFFIKRMAKLNSSRYQFKFTDRLVDPDLYGIATSIIYYLIFLVYNDKGNKDKLPLDISNLTWDILVGDEIYDFLNTDGIHELFDKRGFTRDGQINLNFYEYIGLNHPFVRLIQSLVNHSPKIRFIRNNGFKTYICESRKTQPITMSYPPITTIRELLQSFE